ncbi:MAG: hypothetical protein JXQ76_02190, partial [Campylobacterales bacterium]|nr:hypothetical protein [Campylobacterales bacterium]
NFELFSDEFQTQQELKEQLKLFLTQIEALLKTIEEFDNRDKIIKDLDAIKSKTIPKKFNKIEYIKKLYKDTKYQYNDTNGERKEALLVHLKQEKFEAKIAEQGIYLDDKIINEKIEYLESLNFDEKYINEFDIIESDLKPIKDKESDPSLTRVISSLIEAIDSGAKPRKMYQHDIHNELYGKKFDFIASEGQKEELYCILCNISNLQLRVLRKYFNNKFDNKLDEKKLSIVLHRYFASKHYKKAFEQERKEELFKQLSKHIKLFKDKSIKNANHYNNYDDTKSIYDAVKFLAYCEPQYTIPPFEDMNNRHTYKCNALHINPKRIFKPIKEYMDTLILIDEVEIVTRGAKPSNIKEYASLLQRILDISLDVIDKQIHPREVFKHQKDGSDIKFYQDISPENFKAFSDFAKEYYIKEERAINGIFDEDDNDDKEQNKYIFIKCNKNTPAKRNIKHELINTIFNTNFKNKEAIDKLENTIANIKIKPLKGREKKLTSILEDISEIAKEYQNGFFKALKEAHFYKQYNQEQYEKIDDELKNILLLVDSLKESFLTIFSTLHQQSYLDEKFLFDEPENLRWKHKGKNLRRFINSLVQLHNIIFNDVNGHNKTCKSCTIENNLRSSESEPIAKRLLSDVAKPINGRLDMMLERVAFEVVKHLDSKLLQGTKNIEILLEQNKFSFEESLVELNIKKPSSKKSKSKIISKICPYTGESFDISKGEYDHIISQSSSRNANRQVYNSEANLILCSRDGNKEKTNKNYTFEKLHLNHLQSIFGNKSKEEIKQEIKEIWDSSKGLKYYTNFKNLTQEEKNAFRYALFFDPQNRDEQKYFNQAKALLETSNQTFSNGTQKRLAKWIFKKLPKEHRDNVSVRVIDNKLISETREELSFEYDKVTGEVTKTYPQTSKNETRDKEGHQTSYSHIIDAMVIYHIANQNSFEQFHAIKQDFSPQSDWDTPITTKHWYETNNPKYKIQSKRLFDENDIGVGYLHLQKNITITEKGKENKKIEDVIKNSYPFVWGNISKMRDKMSHNYRGVSAYRVWDIVQNWLPQYKALLIEILQKVEDFQEALDDALNSEYYIHLNYLKK